MVCNLFSCRGAEAQKEIDSLKPIETKLAGGQLLSSDEQSQLDQRVARVQQEVRPSFDKKLFIQQKQYYDWGSNLPYRSSQAANLFVSAAMGLATLPLLTAKAVQSFVQGTAGFVHGEKKSFGLSEAAVKDLTASIGYTAGGALFGIANAALALFYDTFKFISNEFDKLQNPEGHGAFLVIDAQKGFVPGGGLPVANGLEIVPVIQRMLASSPMRRIFSQDYHPLNHLSFAIYQKKAGYTEGLVDGLQQHLWPIHCVEGTRDAEFLEGLPKPDHVVKKGGNPFIDSYSSFMENNKVNKTKLDAYLQANNITTLYMCGLAYDFCVGFSAQDAIAMGYKVVLIDDATRGIGLPINPPLALETPFIDPVSGREISELAHTIDKMKYDLIQLGVEIMTLDQAIASPKHRHNFAQAAQDARIGLIDKRA